MTRIQWWCVLCAAMAMMVIGVFGCVEDDNAVPSEKLPGYYDTDVMINGSEPLFTVSDKFLSFAIDTSQVVGGNWWSADGEATIGVGADEAEPFDFTRTRLRNMARELAPAYLRIGGTEADKVFYDMQNQGLDEAPGKYEFVFTAQHLDSIAEFAQAMGFEIFFTLNAGPGPRDEGKWQPDNARELMTYTAQHHYPVTVWEFGNEMNGYLINYFMTVRPKQYTEDMTALVALRNEITPGIPVAGPSPAFWPVIGEPFKVLEDYLRLGGHLFDIVTWHYYPQQSKRCPITTLPARKGNALFAPFLNEAGNFADTAGSYRDQYAPNAEVWLGETGNAQCGGAPGISDRFVAGFWWLDQLGLMATKGHPVVVRQTLAGSDYGMINDETLNPNPDYWNSLLWKRLMGDRVLATSAEQSPVRLRHYAHCNPDGGGKVTVLLLNLDRELSARVRLADLGIAGAEAYLLTAPDLFGYEIKLNGELLKTDDDGTPPEFTSQKISGDFIEIPPTAYGFFVIDADVSACK